MCYSKPLLKKVKVAPKDPRGGNIGCPPCRGRNHNMDPFG